MDIATLVVDANTETKVLQSTTADRPPKVKVKTAKVEETGGKSKSKKQQKVDELKEKFPFSNEEIIFMQVKRKYISDLISTFGQAYLNAVDPNLGNIPKIDAHSKRQLMLLITLHVRRLKGDDSKKSVMANTYMNKVVNVMEYEEYNENESDMLYAVEELSVNEDVQQQLTADIIRLLKLISFKVGNRHGKKINKHGFNTILKDLDPNLVSFAMYNDIMDLADTDF